MIRTCDGGDPNLVAEDGGPCSCGLKFDDVARMVVFPHLQIRPRSERREIAAAALAAVGVPYVWRTGASTEILAVTNPPPDKAMTDT